MLPEGVPALLLSFYVWSQSSKFVCSVARTSVNSFSFFCDYCDYLCFFVCILVMVSSPSVLTYTENDPYHIYTVLTVMAFKAGLTIVVRDATIRVTFAAIVCLIACEYQRSLSAAVVCND